MSKQYLGLGKTKYNSSVCLIDKDGTVEVLLTERLNRKKCSGVWPEAALKKLMSRLDYNNLVIAENRDVHHPLVIEETQNTFFPFFEFLKKQKLDIFSSKFNPSIEFVTHHKCHAYAALALSPFEKSVIIVMDGAGNETESGEWEECSVYLQNGSDLQLCYTKTITFNQSKNHPGHSFGNQIGASYEKASEFIFNSPNSSGKVMGLASFGNAGEYADHIHFQENLPWEKRFTEKSKKEWEKLDKTLFQDVAASVQSKLEEEYQKILNFVIENHGDYKNLILMGGCALNCTNNARILYERNFENIFVPPFPGDESIGFGLANYLKITNNPDQWQPLEYAEQSAYFGPMDSQPTDESIRAAFNSPEYEIFNSSDVVKSASDLLIQGEIIAWFQGRSESGPRALGNRSILSRPDKPGLKDHLNQNIKFRESFRPYGCSVLYEKAHEYFDVSENFNNPYMSYAVKVRSAFQELLSEVSHVDKTSRMQTVRPGQNKIFYDLIKKFGDQTGLYCLLNTSLNVMDEPILETVMDARRFMDQSPLKYMVIGNCVVTKLS